MDPKDNTPADAPNEEAIKDMTVDDKGSMQDQDMSSEVAESQPVAPEPMSDVTPPPHDEVVAEPVAPAAEVASDAPAAEENAAPSEQVVNPTAGAPFVASASDMPKKSGKGLVVAIAVVFALVLAAIAVLVYLKANSSTKSADTSTTTQQTATTEQVKPVSAADVDTTSKDIDTTMSSLNDAQDFASDAISDSALGLQ